IKQARVLDRYYRLVGKRRGQLDLLVGERPYAVAPERDNADGHSYSQERNAEVGAIPLGCSRSSCVERVYGIFPDVRDLNDFCFKQGPPDTRPSIRLEGKIGHVVVVRARGPESRDQMIARTCRPPDSDDVRLTQSRRQRTKRVE